MDDWYVNNRRNSGETRFARNRPFERRSRPGLRLEPIYLYRRALPRQLTVQRLHSPPAAWPIIPHPDDVPPSLREVVVFTLSVALAIALPALGLALLAFLVLRF